ncbi:enterochelin esterase-like enzyme [Kineococcus radiotolerans]|uniref:Enterochelin esterase-like enzyme n=1 Tax=Kineococcus radiotolerans TaxID=131568 RepID=A0A7W4XX17_KINRA|nr:alpha/beta hydrolase-fold protein [Kineococcus radiotolerans]MBB2900690.1 enterochelin esterase-like enzyme [Kineococcus radiotolerans]
MNPAPVRLPAGVLTALRPPSEWLDSPWLAVGSGILLLVAAAGAVRALRRRRRRAGWVAGVLLAALLTAATTVNAVVGYVPTVQAARFALTGDLDPGGGTVTSFRLGSVPLGVAPSRTYVYLPPGYAAHPGRRYPVVFLLPGSPGRSTDWFGAGDAARTLDVLIARGLLPPVVVVSPDQDAGGTDTECLDVPGGPRWETYLYSDLVPRVDALYRTVPRAASRVLAGMSAGGFCALDQGLRHRGTWGPVVALEPFGDPGSSFRDALGAEGFAAVSPSSYLPGLTVPAPVPVFLGTGAEAGERPGVDALTAQLRAKGWPVLRRDVPGEGHTWVAAREDLPYGLVLAARYLPR